MSAHSLTLRVYYEDTDFSGVVYHASYLRFMERGRTEMLRARDVNQQAIFAGAEPFGFAVRKLGIDFHRPARMDDLLTIETTTTEIGGASLDLRQRILRGHELLVSADVRVACVADGRAMRLPAWLRAKLEA